MSMNGFYISFGLKNLQQQLVLTLEFLIQSFISKNTMTILILFRVNKPYAYFFSSKDNLILRKYGRKLSKQFVYDKLVEK